MKGPILFLIVIALCMRCLSATFRGAFPSGYEPYQPLTDFNNPEDTGLIWMYAGTPPRPKKLKRTDMLLRTRSLILILLIIGCVESHPGEFLQILFFIVLATLFSIDFRKMYLCNLSLIALKVLIAY